MYLVPRKCGLLPCAHVVRLDQSVVLLVVKPNEQMSTFNEDGVHMSILRDLASTLDRHASRTSVGGMLST